MATVDNSWMPAAGRHPVNIGSSLGRALKARKGGATKNPKRSNLPDRDFYSFRYNFKPPSIDNTRPGSIDIKRGKETTNVTVELPTTQDGECHIFTGTEQPSKEWDCVLIYDEETGTFTLEKLESSMALTFERKATSTSRNRPSSSPLPPPPPPSQPAPKAAIDDLDLEAQLEHDLQEKDADGDTDDQFEEIVPKSISYRQEEEEEEEEIIIPPRAPSPPPPPPPPTKTKKAATKAKADPSVSAQSKTTQGKGKQTGRSRAAAVAAAPPPVATYVEEETLEFGQPSRPKKQPPAPQPPPATPSEGLALPGSSSSFAPPPAYPVVPSMDSEEEDWDEVAAVAPAQPGDDGEDGDGEAEEEIDMNLFQAQMDAQLEDFLADAVSPEPETQRAKGLPISLNQFAMGEGVGGEPSQDEDDYSSSEDSDDD